MIILNGPTNLCLGTVQFGLDYGIRRFGQPSAAVAIEILEFAIQNGINTIDTAAAYGTAEEVVGAFLESHVGIRGQIELISKFQPNGIDNVPHERYGVVMRETLLCSLDKLKVNYLDSYLLHNPKHMFDGCIIEALLQLKQAGFVKSIGASVYTPDEAKKGIECGLDILQIPYSVFDQRMAEQGIFDLALRNNVKLHARSAFTQGLMLMEELDVPPHLEKARPVVREYAKFCEDNNVSRLNLAIAFVGRQRSISHLVFGVDRKEQLLEIVRAHKQSVPEGVLDEATLKFAGLNEELIMPSRWKQSE